ncbi:unnamed protein product [Macrosiphum euphorbiae]|uniref:Uncharacterized protein n=1 Tax=Macrosiphum euphorbiae TaxID=13131 RepID=A0AAV0X858_9HEMI|nr:unnamed protein product [Macrosiphum euphorbiae]
MRVLSKQLNLSPLDPYHRTLSIKYIISTPVKQFDSNHEFRKSYKFRYGEINRYISSFNWKLTFSELYLNFSVYALYDAPHFTVLKYIPKSTFNESSFPPWVSKHMKDLILKNKRKEHIHSLNQVP